MKTFVAFVLAALCATAMSDRQTEWAENSKECSQKNNVNIDDVKKVMTGETKPADVSASMKCYFLCMSEKEGLTKNGVFQPQAIIDKVTALNVANKDDLLKAVTACKDTKGTDNCDTAFKIMTCMAQNKGTM